MTIMRRPDEPHRSGPAGSHLHRVRGGGGVLWLLRRGGLPRDDLLPVPTDPAPGVAAPAPCPRRISQPPTGSVVRRAPEPTGQAKVRHAAASRGHPASHGSNPAGPADRPRGRREGSAVLGSSIPPETGAASQD